MANEHDAWLESISRGDYDRLTGYSPAPVAEPATAPEDVGGFQNAFAQSIGTTAAGIGQLGADFVPGVSRENALKTWGEQYAAAHPTAIHSFEAAKAAPWLTVREAAGSAAGFMAPMLATAPVGGALKLAQGAGKLAALSRGVGTAVSKAGPVALAAAPSYGGIREAQGSDEWRDKALALLGAGTVGAIETKFGPQNWALAAMGKEGRAALAKKFAGDTLTRRIGKGVLTGAAVEGAEELVQNPIEQLASYKSPLSEESLGETAFGGMMGAIGGGVLGGGVSALTGRKRDLMKPPVEKLTPTERVSTPTLGMTPDLFTDEYGESKDQYQQAYEDAASEVSAGQAEMFRTNAQMGLSAAGTPLTFGVTSGAKPAVEAVAKAQEKVQKPGKKVATAVAEKPTKKTSPKTPMTWEAIEATVKDHVANGRMTEEQAAEVRSEKAPTPTKARKMIEKAVAETKAAVRTVEGAANALATFSESLPGNQKKAFDLVKAAADNNELDKFISPSGEWQAQAIAEALGLKNRQAAHKAIRDLRKKLDSAAGADVKAALAATTAAVRSYEAPTEESLGLSPAQQASVVNPEELFGSDEGATQGMGVIETVGGAQGAVGAEKAPVSYDTVAAISKAEGISKQEAADVVQSINRELAKPSEGVSAAGVPTDRAIEAAREGRMKALVEAAQNGDLAEAVNTWNDFVDTYPGVEEISPKLSANEENIDFLSEWVNAYMDVRSEVEAHREAGKFIDEVGAYEHEVRRIVRERQRRAEKLVETKPGREAAAVGEKPEVGRGPAETGVVTGAAAAEEVKAKTKIKKRRQIKMSFRAAEPSVGEHTQRVQDALSKAFFTPERMDKLVTIVEDEHGLPRKLFKSMQSVLFSVHGKVNGFVDPESKRVYIIAKNTPPGKELPLLLHEVGVHIGMKNLVGEKNFITLVTQLQTWALDGQGLEGKLARQAMASIKKAEQATGEEYEQEVRDEELMAYFVDLAVSSGVSPTTGVGKQSQVKVWLKKFMDAVRAAIRKIGINPNTLTAKDLVDLAYGAAHLEMSGGRIQFGAGARKYAISEPTGRSTVTYTSEYSMRKAEKFLKKQGKYQTVSVMKTPEGTYEVTRVKKPGIKYSISAAPNAPVWEKAAGAVKEFMINPANTLKEHGLGWLTLTQLGDVAKKVNTAVPQYLKTTREMQSMSKEWVQKAAKIDVDWANVKDADALHETMRESTRASYDPSKGVTPATPEEVALQRKYDALSPEAKGVYEKARDYYAAMREERRSVLLGILDSAYRDRIERAKESGDAKAQAEAEKELTKQRAKVDEAHRGVKGPYFPLMRLGDWYTVGMSAELAALEDKEDKTAEDRKKISELRKDTAHYTTSSYSSKRLAQNAAQKLEGKYDTVRFNVAAIENQATKIVSAAGLQDVESYLNSSFDKGTAARIRDMMTELYYESLPEHHALKREMKREGVHGEEQDMRRVFAVSSMKGSHYLSRMKYADDVRAALFAIKAEGKKDYEAQQVYNEVAKRAALSMDPSETPWADKLVTVSYLAHLGMNPAFILTNATQVPMITMPWLAARSNLGATTRAVSAATSKTYELIKSSWNKQGWRFELDWEGKVSKGQGDMLEEVLKRNLLDITMEHDLGAVAGEKNRTIGDWLRKGNLPVHITELANRSVTALAAYDLAVNQKKMSHEDAVDFAASAVSETQLDYSALNAPRHMQRVLGSAALARITMQFRKYQQGMLYLIGRSIQQAVSGSDAETRRIARRTLFGLATTTGVMAGSIGLPLAGSALWAASLVASLFGDSDDPWDAETEYKNWLAELLGVDAAEAVIKGLPAALLGLDLSKRVGLGDIAKPLPFLREGKTTQETTGNILTAAAGAPVGTIVNTVDGLVMMSQGDWMKGVEKVLPLKIAQNLVKAGRYEYEGMTKRNGEVILPEDRFSAADIGLTAAGFQSTKASTYYEANAAVEEKKAAATEARNQLIKEYAVARMRGRSVSDIRREIAEFNKRHPEQGVRITMSALTRSIQARRRAERERGESGVSTGKANRPYLEEAKFAG